MKLVSKVIVKSRVGNTDLEAKVSNYKLTLDFAYLVHVVFVTIVTNRIRSASIILLFKRVVPKYSLKLNLLLWNTLFYDLWLQTHFS